MDEVLNVVRDPRVKALKDINPLFFCRLANYMFLHKEDPFILRVARGELDMTIQWLESSVNDSASETIEKIKAMGLIWSILRRYGNKNCYGSLDKVREWCRDAVIICLDEETVPCTIERNEYKGVTIQCQFKGRLWKTCVPYNEIHVRFEQPNAYPDED